MSEPITPNMSLLQPITGVTAGSTANDDFNANWSIIDQHTHVAGSGVPITPSAIVINTDFTLSQYNLTDVRSTRYTVQASALALASDVACTYFSGSDFYVNDAAGNQIRITAGGNVNATASGISSGTASAAFVSSVLVVNAAATTPANVRGASFLFGNNSAGSHYLTVAPPNAMSADYGLVLPPLPAVTSIMTLDTSGNMTGAYTLDNATIGLNGSSEIYVKDGGIGTTQLADASVTPAKNSASRYSASSSCGNYLMSSGTFAVVTNLSVTLTLVAHRPVYIQLISDGSLIGGLGIASNTANAQANWRIRNGSTAIATGILQDAGASDFANWPLSSFSMIELDPSAGSATYDFSVRVTNGVGTTDIQVIGAILVVWQPGA